MRGVCVVALAVLGPFAAAGDRAAEDFFEAKVRPILVGKCQPCHGEAKQSGGLRLDSREGVIAGGDGGPAAERIVEAVRRTGERKMPPKEPLPEAEAAAIIEWVRGGMTWPAAGKPNPLAPHWAFARLRPLTAPGAESNPIDAFVRARLGALKPNPRADRRTLIRRLTFDLHGLPPTPGEVDAYVNDPSPDADARLVERLLASPRYGERWGRHWLDVARYADTKGYFFEGERRYPYAYTYRDYVVRAFNEDKPYDQFIVEQLAADKLGGDPANLAAMGFLTVGRRFLNNVHDIIDDRLDVTFRGFMGLTVSCARCHDHKYDPIPTADYYSLYGVYASAAEPAEPPLLGPIQRTPGYEAYEKELTKRRGDVEAFLQRKADQATAALRLGYALAADERTAVAAFVPYPPVKREQVRKRFTIADRNELQRLDNAVESHKALSPDAPPRGMVINDLPDPVEPRVLVRGNPGNVGPAVPRQFLAVVAGPKRKPFQHDSGRLELARAIADPNNPLTPRVLVNRVWMHHFGTGLVTTPSDFGRRSDPPSHPELLDWLARRFVDDGWSVKQLHRLIVLSQTYRQSSADRTDALAADPDNRLLWKFTRQRLDFEAIRDAMLAVSGLLDTKLGGPAVDLAREPFVPRRTVYGFIDRQNLPGMFRTFDFASPDTHAPQRYVTTVPQQALYLMNSPFVTHVATALANRPEVAAALTVEERVDVLYRHVLGRGATAREVAAGRRFVADATWDRFSQALLLTNEFAFVE
jgi:hypothetical protein